MKKERSQSGARKGVQTRAAGKKTAIKRYKPPKVQEVISGGYEGPYPLIKKLNNPEFNRRTRISNSWGD